MKCILRMTFLLVALSIAGCGDFASDNNLTKSILYEKGYKDVIALNQESGLARKRCPNRWFGLNYDTKFIAKTPEGKHVLGTLYQCIDSEPVIVIEQDIN